MFCPEDLLGLGGKTRETNVYLNGRKAYPVKLHMVQFTEQGMAKIGQGLRAVSNRYAIHLNRMKELMMDNMYIVPPNTSLYFLFNIPELNADIHVEIPHKFWRLTDLAKNEFPNLDEAMAQSMQSPSEGLEGTTAEAV